ncbi:MAG: phenylalanyl-tRNA synthetase subunit alpha [Deltaproteobacteria bacterium]|nr:phenylalanyl-tRNA synthetase subunit alpha [Deltaproteobacteria bacterium]
MRATLERIHRDALAALEAARSEAEVEQLRIRFLGRKGELTEAVRGLRDVPKSDRPAVGAFLNDVKDDVERRIDSALGALRAAARDRQIAGERVDVTLPGRHHIPGHLHLISQTLDEMVDIFVGLGFSVAQGPDIEDDYHNFTALNVPADHPARDMQDTLFVGEEFLLRTHTSPVQIRVMEQCKPPLRVIAPGACYRHDDDVTHSPMFHQVEGFMVDRHVTFGDLKGVLTLALRRIFGDDTPLRFRASFFPFTEPSAEVDIGCVMCGGRASGCRVCKGTGWLEILGSGMIDPNVFEAVGYDPEAFSGFAFGLAVERVAMLKHQISDIRLFFANDIRFLRQF